nr:ADP-ribosylglycohydrolase family protein [Methanocalculus sp. AMF5]
MVIFIFQFTRIPGTIIGSAIGDAMGAPFEGSDFVAQIPERMASGGPFSTRKGEYTDDTHQMIALARTLATCRGFEAADFLHRLVEIYLLHPEYFGPTSSAVLKAVVRGVDPAKARESVPKESRSNGAVMRGAPLGIFYRPPDVVLMSSIAAAVTHTHPVAIACSTTVNHMISILCRGGTREEAFFHALESCTSPEVRRRLARLSSTPLVPSLDALDTTHAAVTCWMEEPTYPKMIQRAIALGGDTDTVAAICGALGGATFGLAGIPGVWIADLEGAEELLLLEEKVWNAGQK